MTSKSTKLSPESRLIIWNACRCSCIIRNEKSCGMGYTASHFFKSNTMKGNPYWKYEDENNAVVMCSVHHDQFEKLNALERIQYIKDYSIVSFTDKIVERMVNLYERKRPERIY